MDDITLRLVEDHDLELLLAWRSHPEVYEHFREQDGPLQWENHIEWFESRPPGREDYIIEYEGRRVGSVSLSEEGEVGIYIGEVTLWGEGVASDALQLACEKTDRETLFAEIHRANENSQKLFERCGFKRIDSEEGWLWYRKQL